MHEESTRVEPPDVGTIKIKYGKTRVHQAYCNTCRAGPHGIGGRQWRGHMHSRKDEAFGEAILHAVKEHSWKPGV